MSINDLIAEFSGKPVIQKNLKAAILNVAQDNGFNVFFETGSNLIAYGDRQSFDNRADLEAIVKKDFGKKVFNQ